MDRICGNIYHFKPVSDSYREEIGMEIMIGKVIHFYPKVSVAAIVPEDHLLPGDRIISTVAAGISTRP